MKNIVVALSLLSFLAGCTPQESQPVNIIPKPLNLTVKEGSLQLRNGMPIYLSQPTDLEFVAGLLSEKLKTSTGITLKKVDKNPAKGIRILLDSNLSSQLGPEGYELSTGPSGITLNGATPAGCFYGIQTLFQLLPAEIYSGEAASGIKWTVPYVEISDQPRFSWRGYMLDVSRHFFPIEHLYRVVDQLAMHKLNYFHLHLVDDQGWRLEIKKYPRLTEIGAWRVDRSDKHWNSRDPQQPGEKATYGGFYKQQEIKDLVKYASDRNITIVPEIEMPAHSTAALAAYPEFSCTGDSLTVLPGGIWPCDNIFCAGKEETFGFLQDVLVEVMELFPSQYIHIGGDEADKSKWKECPLCQKRIRQEGLSNEHELQSYFIKRMDKWLTSQGRSLIGWDEILEGGLAPNAAVMSWRGTQGGIDAARSGHKVVMSPTSHCYFDYYQGAPENEPLAIGGYLPLEKVYSFEPVPSELNETEGAWIIGVQANLWTEYVTNPDHADYMTYPRLAALSELAWTPASMKDYADFTGRLTFQLERYNSAGIKFSKSFSAVTIHTQYNETSNKVEVELTSALPSVGIRYTLDGSDPAGGMDYSQPFSLDKTTVIRAVAIQDNAVFSGVSEKKILLHKACGRNVAYQTNYSPKYPGTGNSTLVNGIRGTVNFSDGSWQGFDGSDLACTIDLGSMQQVSQVTVGALQAPGSWIFFPTKATLETAGEDGVFTMARSVDIAESTTDPERKVRDFTLTTEPREVRFIRLTVTNLGRCPQGHAGAGNPCWMFIDEILVD